MTQGSSDDQERAQGIGEAAYGDQDAADRLEDRLEEPQELEREGEKQAEREEKEYGDSAAAVSSDTQFADPRRGSGPAPTQELDEQP